MARGDTHRLIRWLWTSRRLDARLVRLGLLPVSAGWRLATRSMTFLRRSGDQDSGRPHDPTRPEPSAS